MLNFTSNPALNSLFGINVNDDFIIITPDGYVGRISGIKMPETCTGMIARNSNLISVLANIPPGVKPFSRNIVVPVTGDTLTVEDLAGATVLHPAYLDGQVVQDFDFDPLTGEFDFTAINGLAAGSILTIWYTL